MVLQGTIALNYKMHVHVAILGNIFQLTCSDRYSKTKQRTYKQHEVKEMPLLETSVIS